MASCHYIGLILKGAHYRTSKLMEVRFFIGDAKNKVNIMYVASTQDYVKYYATIVQPNTDT